MGTPPTHSGKTGADDDLFRTAAPLPVAPLDDRQRLACIQLIRSENVGPVTFRHLINTFGGAEEALTALPELVRRSGKKTYRLCPVAKAEAELEAAHRAGAAPLFTIEPGYPQALAALDVPPPLIYVAGNAALLNATSVAIVGARQASAAGCKMARMMAHDLGRVGIVVTSGLARGIDGAAHTAALATGTIAVVAGGLDIIYPPEHADLHAAIKEQGCLLSEMPCGFRPRAQDFPRRNRLISGLSLGVIVVEAAKRSGTLVTARYAGEQGREVFAVPGHPLDPRAEGTNGLIKAGATLVTSADDVIEHLAPLTSEPKVAFSQARAAQFDTTPDDGSARGRLPTPQSIALPTDCKTDIGDAAALSAIRTSLGPAPIEIDELARATGLAIGTVTALLIELDLGGDIVRHGQQLVSLAPSARIDR